MIFTDDPVRRFEEFDKNDFARTDDNLGIQYEKDDIFEDTVLLLRYNCPDEDCDVACLGWPDLHRHVKSKHSKVMWYVQIGFDVGLASATNEPAVTCVLETKRSLHTNIPFLPPQNCGNMRSTEMTSQVQSTRVASRDTRNVVSVANDFMATTNFIPIAEISTKDATSVTAALHTGNSSTMLIIMHSRAISKKIISCALIQNVWKRSSWFSSLKWI